jgi:hypothetical protein
MAPPVGRPAHRDPKELRESPGRREVLDFKGLKGDSELRELTTQVHRGRKGLKA